MDRPNTICNFAGRMRTQTPTTRIVFFNSTTYGLALSTRTGAREKYSMMGDVFNVSDMTF